MKTRNDILVNPLYIASVLVLFASDFVFKYAFPGLITGKLSDFAGVFAFTAFGMAVFPEHTKKVAWTSILWFLYWKSPYSQFLIDYFNRYSSHQINRVVDYSDLWALLTVPAALLYFDRKKAEPSKIFRLSHFTILACSLLVFCSTSKASKYGYGHERTRSFSSTYHWRTKQSSAQLEEKFIKIATEACRDSTENSWQLYGMHSNNYVTYDVYLDLIPKKNRTIVRLKTIVAHYHDNIIRYRDLELPFYYSVESTQ